jgi:hypothetical protein
MDRSEYERRQDQLEAAETPLEVDRLFAQWHEQDRQAAAAAIRLADIRRRLAVLEQSMQQLPQAIGEVLPRYFRQELQKHGGLSYAGVHDDRPYAKNVLVTCSGSLWVSVAEVTKSERPGKSPSWRLVAKSGSAPTTPVIA